MPRKARSINKEGFFHIMVQGINKSYIFESHNQKVEFLKLMKKYKEKYNIKVIAYCVMNNHVHILLYSNDINEISNYMKCLNGAYGIYYNKTNNRIGFVYRNRYQSQYIYDEDYLKKCIKYIHMNPVKANIVQLESQYRYSSYREYMQEKFKFLIDKDIIKNIFKAENYVEEFFKMKDIPIEVMDIDREEENFRIAVEDFLNKEKMRLIDIIENKSKIKELCIKLKTKGYKQVQLAKLLNMSEGQISKILRN